MFFNPEQLHEPGMIDDLIRGMSTTSIETLDQFITDEVTNHLFEDKHTPYSGLDLAALNIQRGRDHGLPGYNLYRAICNLTRADDFGGLRREIAPPVIERLRRTYAHVDDVDLFTGLQNIDVFVTMATNKISGFFRWFGRNPSSWWSSGPHLRLHHWYSVPEFA